MEWACCITRSGSTSTRLTTRRLLVGRKRKTPQGLGISPPAKGVQTAPHPVPPPPVVVQHLPFTGQENSENDFIHVRPVPPDIKVSTLKSSMFYLPDANIFMDKSLPDSEPVFLSRLASPPSFPPSFFTDLHFLVNAPGLNYPQGTYNYLGARRSLAHTKLNIPLWRELLADYPKKELVDFLEYGFPVGVDPDGPTKPSLKK